MPGVTVIEYVIMYTNAELRIIVNVVYKQECKYTIGIILSGLSYLVIWVCYSAN